VVRAAHFSHGVGRSWSSRPARWGWYPALDAAGVRRRGPYHLRHTFATEALAAGMPTFLLARVMGCSLQMIDKHYGHLAHDSEDAARALLNARAAS
jgi:integrase